MSINLRYVEIKCQLDVTDDFYCRSYCLLNMFRTSLCPSSGARRLLYRWLLPVVFGALVFKLSVWCRAEGYVSGVRDAAAAANRTHNPQIYTISTTWKPKHQIPQAATTCIILFELLMMGIVMSETCWASNKICNKNHRLHLVGILFPHVKDDARSKPHQIYKVTSRAWNIILKWVRTKYFDGVKIWGYIWSINVTRT